MKLKQFKNHLKYLTGAILFDYRGHSCGGGILLVKIIMTYGVVMT